MSFPISDALTLIRSVRLLLKEEPLILSSPEDAAYFRIRHTNLNLESDPTQNQGSLKISLDSKGNELKTLAEIALPQLSSSAKPIEKIKVDLLPPPTAPKFEVSQLQPREATLRPASQFRSILEKVAPELAILDSIPDDSTAKQIANRWRTKNQSAPISILSSEELPQHKALLAEIAVALDVYFGEARFIEADPIEKEKQWKTFLSVESLKLIVVCDSTLWQLHHLRQFYKETPATGARMLGNVPIFLLPDLSLYLKDSPLKRSLWKALCSKLS